MKKFIPYILFFVGLVLVGGAGFYAWHAASPQPASVSSAVSAPGLVPQSMAGLPLAQTLSGQPAIDSFKQSMGLDFPPASVTMAQYGQNSANLWLAETESDAKALDLILQFEAKIAQGGLPISPMGVFEFQKRKVFMLNSADRTHFFIQSGKNVFWLAILPEQTETAMKELLAFYP